MNPFAWSGLLLGVSTFLFGCFSYLKNSKQFLNKIWALFNLVAAVWGFGGLLIGITQDKELALYYWRWAHMGVVFIPVFFYHSVISLVGINRRRKKFIKIIYIVGIIFFILNLTGYLIKKVDWAFNSFYYDGRPPTLLYSIFTFLWFSLVIYAQYELLREYSKASALKKIQIKYFFLSMTIGFAGGGMCFLPVFGIDIYPYGNFTVPLYPAIMTYAIFRYQLLDIKIAISRATIFIVIYSLVLGIPFWLGYHLLGKGLWILPVALTVIFASAGPIVFRIIQKKAENLLFAKQKRYQKLLLQAARGMVREHNLDRLLKLTVHVIKRAVKVEFVGVFLEDKDSGDYMLKAVRNHNTFPKYLNLSSSCPLVECFKQERKILMYEEVDSLIHSHLGKEVHLAVPSFIENRLLGFLVLGEKDDRSVYTQDDIGVFEILSRQAALAIEHCLFLEEFKHAQDKIFQAEKLATIGGMASGIAHQMRNRLNLFSVAIGEMQFEFKDFIDKHPQLISDNEDLKKSLDYALSAARTISDNVKRTADVINGILNFARAEVTDTEFSSFSLKEAVELALMPLKTKHSIENVPLELNISPADMIYGVRSQLIEVILNLLDNAYEAVMEKFKYRLKEDEKKNFVPLIKMSLINDGGLSLIEVSDNGVGVKAEDRKKIFAPFFTTKSSVISGTGIGMFVVQRIVEENHKGRVWFESEYMQGAKFFVELPKKKWG